MNTNISVYCLPGMGASSKIFKRIKLPPPFKLHLLEWEEPLNSEENLRDYALRITKKITSPTPPILLGVSFGGIVMQEVAKLIPYDKLVLISSVKTRNELPPWLKLAGLLKLYHFLPANLICNENIYRYFKRGRNLYLPYMRKNTPLYLRWAVKNTTLWQQTFPLSNTIHIQGDKDLMFPIRFIDNPIIIKKGTHIMIINRFKWFCEHLPNLLLRRD